MPEMGGDIIKEDVAYILSKLIMSYFTKKCNTPEIKRDHLEEPIV